MQSRAGSMRVNDGPDEWVNLSEAEYVCSGCHSTWDHVRELRHNRTALLVQGTMRRQ